MTLGMRTYKSLRIYIILTPERYFAMLVKRDK
jgi:hypothetical protein